MNSEETETSGNLKAKGRAYMEGKTSQASRSNFCRICKEEFYLALS